MGGGRFWEKWWLVFAATAGLAALYLAWGTYVSLHGKVIDFYSYYVTAAGFQRGLDIYTLPSSGWQTLARSLALPADTPPYRYSPLLAICIMPLLALPARWAGLVWAVLSAAAAMGATALLSSALGGTKSRLPLAWGLLALFTPVLVTLYSGQVNTFILLTVAWAFWAFKRGHSLEAGLALALGTMLKVMPVVLIAYFVWRRQWRVVIGAALGLAALSLFSVVVVGPAAFLSYVQQAGLHSDPQFAIAYPPNQSLIGFFSRLLTAHEWGGSLADNPGLAWLVGRVLGLAVLAATFWLCRPSQPLGDRVDLEVALVVIATHLFPSESWFHHLTLLLVPVSVLLWRGLDAGGWRDARVWCVAACLVLLAVQGLLWHQLVGWTLLLSLGTYVMVWLWIVVARGIDRADGRRAA